MFYVELKGNERTPVIFNLQCLKRVTTAIKRNFHLYLAIFEMIWNNLPTLFNNTILCGVSKRGFK